MNLDPKYELMRVRLLRDLSAVGVPVDLFDLFIKDYSATYYGCYRTKTNRVYLYAYEDKDLTTMYNYDHMLEIALHEAVHAIQWHDASHIRVKGVMHDAEFWQAYNMYTTRLKERNYVQTAKETAKVLGDSHQSSVHYLYRGVECSDTGAVARPNNRVLRIACKRRNR